MLEEKSQKTMGQTITWYEDEDGHQYRRIVGGVAFPYGAKPGFAVVLGEDLKADHSLMNSPHHIRLLAEHEDADIEALHRACIKFRDEYCALYYYGDPERPVYKLWEKIQGVSITAQYEGLDLDVSLQLVRRFVGKGNKTLHFGPGSKLPGYLSGVSPDDVDKEIDCFPAIAALGRALAEIGLNGYSQGVYKPKRARAIRRG